jgi:hypothetical protein
LIVWLIGRPDEYAIPIMGVLSISPTKRGIKISIALGLIIALFLNVISRLIFGSWVIVEGGIVGFAISVLTMPLFSKVVIYMPRESPDQGGWNSIFRAFHSIIIGTATGGILWLIDNQIKISMVKVMAILISFVGIYTGVDIGLYALISHYSLRLVLSASRYLPWRLEKFLKYSSDLILLRQVGGGFEFIHPMLLDYFANLKTESVTRSVQK